MIHLKIALDWTPNINHIGIFVAKELGFYSENDIELEIINPIEDNYEVTPGKKLELGLADFVIAPFETVISLNNKKNAVDAIAIFAILQEDISSIVSLKSKNIDSPKLLDGKIYASYKARYEDKIVQKLVKNAGGNGTITIVYPEKLGIWNTLLAGKADATWIFDNWEGVEADDKNIELNKWSLKEYGIPYGYSPVIITKKSRLATSKSNYFNFIKATQKGFLFAIEMQINKAKMMFEKAFKKHNYEGSYNYCYCTKSSHFSFIVEETLRHNIHLETSFAYDIEIINQLFLKKKITKDTFIICNGYKQKSYTSRIARLINTGFKNVIPI